MPPKSMKGNRRSEMCSKDTTKAAPKKNPQEKKANKKEADKNVNEGVKLIKKAEEEVDAKKKMKSLDQAKTCFLNALSSMENHADALYNLAIVELELVYEDCDAENITKERVQSLLSSPCRILSTVVANDTSHRGETTGLAHRILANVYCRYHHAMASAAGSSNFDSMVEKVKSHINASVTILANHPELDTLLFESCQLFHGMMSARMNEEGDKCADMALTLSHVAFLRERIDDCLQTPQSSGIDIDVKLLDGAVLIDVMSYIIAILSVTAADTHNQFLQDCLSASLQLHDTLVSFVPDDADVQMVAGDLVQSAMELHDAMCAINGGSDGAETVFRVTESGLAELDLQKWLTKLITCRCIVTLQEPSANSFLALGDDLKAIAELVGSDSTRRCGGQFVAGVLEILALAGIKDGAGLKVLLGLQQGTICMPPSSGVSTIASDAGGEEVAACAAAVSVYAAARSCYEKALSVYYCKLSEGPGQKKKGAGEEGDSDDDDDDDEDDDDPDNISAIHYNLLCVLWILKDADIATSSDDAGRNGVDLSSLCRHHFEKYLAIEVKKDEVESCGDDAKGQSPCVDIVRTVMQDVDLQGISGCDWVAEVLALHGLDLCALGLSAQNAKNK